MSGGHFNYACYKTDDFSQAGALIHLVREMRHYCQSVHPRAVIYLDLYLLKLEEMQSAFLEQGEAIHDLLHAIEWEASGDRSIDDVTVVLDCMGIGSHE